MDNKDVIKAAKVLQDAEQKNLKECADKIEQTLSEHKAKILPEFLLLGTSVRSGYRIVSDRSGSGSSIPGIENENNK